MSAQIQRVQLQVEGPSFAYSGTSRVPLDKIQPLRRVPGGTTYVRRIVLVFRGVFKADASAGNQSLGERHAHDIVHGLFFRIPGRSYPVLELPSRAGSHLFATMHAITGKRPRAHGGGGAITVAEAGTAVRLVYEIPLYCPYGVEPEDWGMPLSLLQNQAAIEVIYSANGLFGANVDASDAVTGTMTAYADLIERPEFRVPQPFSIQSFQLSGPQEQVPVAGRVLHWLLEVPVHAAGLTDGTITDAARDEITVTIDGLDVTRQMDARDQVLAWNQSFAKARAEELPDVETDGATHVPWFMPHRDENKVTQLPLCIGQPQVRLTGTSNTPRCVAITTELNTRQAVMGEIGRAGIPVPPGLAQSPERYLTVKTASKSAARAGAAVAARLPVRVHQQAVA